MTHFEQHPGFERRGDELYCEDVPLSRIAAQAGATAYVYSRARIERNFLAYQEAMKEGPHLVCYALKANSTLGVLRVLAALGAGADTVSGGEIARALRAGFAADRIVYSGVGKTPREIRFALRAGIRCFNVESEPELELINEIAMKEGLRAPVSLRCNPDVDARTHPYISTGLKSNKFGIPIERAEALYLRAANMPGLRVTGIDAHIGSQLTDVRPLLESAEKLIAAMSRLRAKGLELSHLDIGGGLGIRYRSEDTPPHPRDLAVPVRAMLRDAGFADAELLVEPGRSIVGDAGVMITPVLYVKQGAERRFCVVEGAMTDLIRPALYSAWMGIEPVVLRSSEKPEVMDVVGPVCESSDFLGKARELAVKPGDWLAVRDAGAYGATMASRYNSRPLPLEYLVDGSRVLPLRRPDTLEDIVAGEIDPEL